MEIERINDNTVKFYISYGDIEERGFDREEIWYNRERSEELFWEMMDEVHQEENFTIEGPLWIQVQALDKGLEVLVTRAQVTKDGQKFELPIPEDKIKDLPVDERIEDFLDQHFQMKQDQNEDEGALEFTIKFKDFEDVISLSHKMISTDYEHLSTKLFSFEGTYYIHIEFSDEQFTEDEIDNVLSIMLEYGNESSLTVHRLNEYGTTVMNEDVFHTVTKHFS
ncbi:adaptor protein MecA [Rossellomorea vietnamensis]|uniref:Adapter protein MecA n=1 Tax=Rossellomorea vietnamensis TaxID=218284 RepID=A0A5D4NSQ1_9BACI|nr:adaptor protein MecA [Rossellomorea vietnamensis]TYS15822.1 adaptor protein MecA [Rossellomorea vietnamensis]